MSSKIEEGTQNTLQGPLAQKAGAASETRKGRQERPKAPRVSHNRELAAVALGAVSLAAGLGGLLGSGPDPAAPTGGAATGSEVGSAAPPEARVEARFEGSATEDGP